MQISVHPSDLFRRAVDFEVEKVDYYTLLDLPLGSLVFVESGRGFVEGRIRLHNYRLNEQGQNICIELVNGTIYMRPNDQYHEVYIEKEKPAQT